MEFLRIYNKIFRKLNFETKFLISILLKLSNEEKFYRNSTECKLLIIKFTFFENFTFQKIYVEKLKQISLFSIEMHKIKFSRKVKYL